MRITFMLLRLQGYLSVLIPIFWHPYAEGILQWTVSLLVSLWGIWDQWKKPDAPPRVLLKGVWVETISITLWALFMHSPYVLFLYISPLARACIHLSWHHCMTLVLCHVALSATMNFWMATPSWLFYAQIGAYGSFSIYTFVIGELVRHRDKLRRLVLIGAFERDEQMKNEERIRIAGELHDVMGQYWTAVVRALDVAGLVQGEQQAMFISKAREAAIAGLEEMRNAVKGWNEGRQTPEDWMLFMHSSVSRFSDVTNIDVRMRSNAIDWHRTENPVLTAETIARTVVESMTNAVRHASPTIVDIHVELRADEIRVSVRDNGSGIAHVSTQGEAEGIGLRTMRKLAAASGGTLHLESSRGKGTGVLLRVPLQGHNKDKSIDDAQMVQEGELSV